MAEQPARTRQVAERPDRAIEQAGLTIVAASTSKEAVLFGGREVAFFFVENVGLIEIIRGAAAERGDALAELGDGT